MSNISAQQSRTFRIGLRQTHARPGLKLLALGISLAFVVCSSPAGAHDDSDTGPNGIWTTSDFFAPVSDGTRMTDDAFNGFKIYLSSPRHSTSGNKGECDNPGRPENVNGRRWNFFAANGYAPADTSINPALYIHGRGFKVQVSPNTKDNGYEANRTASENWGSDVHIITHTNATTDGSPSCAGASGYFYTAWAHDANAKDDYDLTVAIAGYLNPQVPGSWSNPRRTDLSELYRNAPKGDAYVELQMHDYQTTQTWLYNNTDLGTARYLALAIDDYLNYP